MDLTIRINGEVIDGVSANSVKLTINNPDPLKFTEQTASYSGTINIPRSEVNDRVFRSERFPGTFTRTSPYMAEVFFGGFNVPFGGGLFRVRVTADEDGYSLELVETISKLSAVRSPISYIGTYSTEAYQMTRYKDILEAGYPGTVTLPTVYRANGTTPIGMAYVANQTEHVASDFLDMESQLGYFGSHDGLLGSVYPTNYLVVLAPELTAAFRYHTGTTFDLEFTSDSFVVLPPSVPGTVYLRSNAGTFALPFNRQFLRPDGNWVYRPVNADTTSCIITPRLDGSMTFGFTTSASSMVYAGVPVSTMPVSESHFISFRVKNASNPDHKWNYALGVGFDTTFEIVQAYCKGFCWTYEFKSQPFSLTIKPFVNPSTSSTYRVDLTGKIDTASVKVSEAANAARSYAVQIGALKRAVPGYPGAISTQETVGESAFAVNPSSQKPYATAIYANTAGTVWFPDNYFSRASGYRATIAGHYDRFSPGWQITAKMNLSYFDIQKMKSDALYFVGELNYWFYLRTISNWDASTGNANVTLIAVKN